MMKLVAIVGGIGSGKSVVSSVLRVMGYNVYDCDSRARSLMNSSAAIQHDLMAAFGPDVITGDGTVDAPRLSSLVFADKSLLLTLNSIVHPRVKDDLLQWASGCGSDVAFFETAILRESGFSAVCDAVWCVAAPDEVRVRRVMARNGVSEADVRARIQAQNNDYSDLHDCSFICNDGVAALLPQIHDLLHNLV